MRSRTRKFQNRLLLVGVLISLFTVVIFLLPTCAKAQPEPPWDRVARFQDILEFYREDIHFGTEAGEAKMRGEDLDSLFVRAILSAHQRCFILVAVYPAGPKVPLEMERTVGSVTTITVDTLYLTYRLRFSIESGPAGSNPPGTLMDPTFERVERSLARLDEAIATAYEPLENEESQFGVLRSAVFRIRNEAALANLLICLGQEAQGLGELQVDLSLLTWMLELTEQYGVVPSPELDRLELPTVQTLAR